MSEVVGKWDLPLLGILHANANRIGSLLLDHVAMLLVTRLSDTSIIYKLLAH